MTENELTPVRDATRFWVTAVMGILGGVLAVPGVVAALYITGHGTFFLGYIVLIGPAVEEILKQSGMLFLLTRRPYLISRHWQFPLGSILGGLTFAVLENLIYQYIFLMNFPEEQWRDIMLYRWTACTLLHMACSSISGLGLMFGWRCAGRNGNMFQFKYAFFYLGLAIAVHGTYNLVVTLFFR